MQEAERYLQEMQTRGLETTVATYTAVIDACAKSGNVERAEMWFARMAESNVEANVITYSALIDACAKRAGPDGAEAAERWLDHSEQAGVVNDVVVYSSVIDACGKAGDAGRALQVFRRMQAVGLRPHIIAYAALARPFAHRGDWIKVESIAQGMASAGVKPNEYFLYA